MFGRTRRRTGEFLSWQHYTHFPATATFAPDVLILGKAMQLACVATKKVPAVTATTSEGGTVKLPGGFSLSPDGEEVTTTTLGIRRERMLYVLNFLRGKVPLNAPGGDGLPRPTNPPVFYNFREEARAMHAIVESALEAHWPKESFSEDDEVWGCGLIWFVREDVYEKFALKAAVFSVLDEEPVTRCLLPVRPLQRLELFLSEQFSRFAKGAKRKRDNIAQSRSEQQQQHQRGRRSSE